MAEVTVLPPGHTMDHAREGVGADIYPAATNVSAPAPNPNFSFPMLPPADTLRSSDYPEAEGSTLRSTSHRSRPSNISISPLSPFGFPMPSPSRTPSTMEPAEHSPTRSINIPSRGGGHRRKGSEFIGGDGSVAGPGLMSTSPTKGEGVLPSPVVSGASGRRRGHAHRRSGAISNHDLTAMLKPNNETMPGYRAGSAPNSPADPGAHRRFMPSLDRSASQPTLKQPVYGDNTPIGGSRQSPDQSPTHKSSPNAQARPRVGFSDTLEFIPRPLSTISSETSSSLSTVRASHSVTGSISSVISNGTSSPSSVKKQQHTSDMLREYRIGDARPRTADSPLDSPLNSPFRRQLTPPYRPSSAGAGKMLNQNDLYVTGLNPFFAGNASGQDPLPPHVLSDTTNSTPLASPQFHADLQRLRGVQEKRTESPTNRPRSSPEAKVSKKHKKVKTWAGSLLSRKPKTHSSETLKSPETLSNTSSPSSELHEFVPIGDFSLDDVNFDEDTTFVIKSPDYDAPLSARSANNTTWISSEDEEAEVPGAVLDLDATWNALDEQDTSPGLSAKRRMHSSGATGGFAGPGMHYHRRAESAPALTPIINTPGFTRHGSNPQMADVFEEEEEEEGASKSAKMRSHSARPSDETELRGLGVQIVESDFGGDAMQRPNRRRHLDLQRQRSTSPKEHRQAEVNDNPALDFGESTDLAVEVVDDVDEPRYSLATKSSDESTITPTFSDLLPHTDDAALPASLDSAHASSRQFGEGLNNVSSYPSPDGAYASFDAPRLHTSASSITDRSTWSSARPIDAGPALSYSTEDVPSLTSSASTMISGHPPQLSPVLSSRQPAERSFSLSAAVPRQPRPFSAGGKRSSLASLSRLVGSSYGEKSKLSLESSAQEDSVKHDKKKRHRISRLMKFWKSKEDLRSTADD